MDSTTLYAIIIGTVVILGAAFAWFRIGTKNKTSHDPRKHLTPNDTNYNQNMFDTERLQSMTREEAKQFLANLEESEQVTSLSPRDFAELKKKVGR